MNILEIKNLKNIGKTAKIFLEKNKDKKIFAFFGEMGVGKTTFIRAICENLKVIDMVNSPTFSIVNEYFTEKNTIIYHFDFYRINNINEIFDFGYEEYFYSKNYCFIEWSEKIEKFLPKESLMVFMEKKENKVFLKF
ncbi:MAG: tRNA (adenosine(37)-N6)-threonylcarbamoyltransferase complex ATPase subunit type 1 TsaE [Bacteroidetes bacterium 4572_128]|nr:MAG: tRNA (adenosine(37)-N6)-threonylcarbamoyltransferase complex ATPase subunit type 1 TsaE [Bacteroidetes bacterium 4572_128]